MPFETFLGRLKVTVTLGLFWAITPTHMHGFQNNLGVLLEE